MCRFVGNSNGRDVNWARSLNYISYDIIFRLEESDIARAQIMKEEMFAMLVRNPITRNIPWFVISTNEHSAANA